MAFDLSKLKGSKTEEAYEGKLAKVAKPLSIQYDYMYFENGDDAYETEDTQERLSDKRERLDKNK